MEEIKDFENFYSIIFKPTLSDLKFQNSDAFGWRIAGLIFLMFAIMCFFLSQITVGISLLIFVLISIYKYKKKKTIFIKSFKETVTGEAIKYLEPGLIYKPDEYISPVDYEKSSLFRKIYDNYNGSGLISGYANNVHFFCSELETSYENPSKGKAITIFKGLFFAIPLKIYFPGAIYIWPKGDEQLTKKSIDDYYSLFPLNEVYFINLNDIVFENTFSVYSSNPENAASFINQEYRERLINLQAAAGKEIRFSILSGICYLSISRDDALVKPSFSNNDNIELAKEIYSSVQFILNAINQLNLKRFL